jgi:hypothetical protein
MRVFRVSRVPPLFSGRRDGCVRMFRYECVKWVEAGIGLDSERNTWALKTPRRRLFLLACEGKEGMSRDHLLLSASRDVSLENLLNIYIVAGDM